MENEWTQEKEALQALTEYSPRLLKAMREVVAELKGERKEDTDEYLLGIVKGMNWELQVFNGTMNYLNLEEELINKEAANQTILAFNNAYQAKDDAKIAELLEKNVITLFEDLEKAAAKRA